MPTRSSPPRDRKRFAVVISAVVAIGLTLGAVTARAQFGFDTAAILLRILTQNVEINGKLATNNTLTKNYWDWHRDDLAAGYKLAVPFIDRRITKLFRSRDIGYLEPELRRIEQMTRDVDEARAIAG